MPRKSKYLMENEIPDWIRSSPYLQALLENEPLPKKGLQVPKWCLKRDTRINCHNDAVQFLRTAHYWLLSDEIIFDSSFLQYCFMTSKVATRFDSMRDLERDHPQLLGLAATSTAPDNKKIELAAYHGNYHLLKYFCEVLLLKPNVESLEAAIRIGSVQCLQYIRTQRPYLASNYGSDFVALAARHGQLSCLKYLYQIGTPLSIASVAQAADDYAGQVECLEFILQNRAVTNHDLCSSTLLAMCEISAKFGAFESMKILLKYVPLPKLHAAILNGAGNSGNLATIKLCLEHRVHVSDAMKITLLTNSARCRNLESMLYLHSLGYRGDEGTFEAAAAGGNMDCIRFLFEQHCPVNASVCAVLAAHGNYAGLVYAKEQNFPWDASTCAGAAKSSIKCLTYVHQNHCPWDTHACIAAAGAGRLDCLQYAQKHGCPWDERTCDAAARGGHLVCLQFAHEKGCPWKLKSKSSDVKCEHIAVSAARAPTVDCLKYVVERGARVRKAVFFNAAHARCLESLQFLHAQSCPWDTSVITEAASEGAVDCVRFLHERGCPWSENTYVAVLGTSYEYRVKSKCSVCESHVWEDRVLECKKYLQDNNCPRPKYRPNYWYSF